MDAQEAAWNSGYDSGIEVGEEARAILKERIAELEIAVKVIIGHWDEFGPEHDFAETVEIARRLVNK